MEGALLPIPSDTLVEVASQTWWLLYVQRSLLQMENKFLVRRYKCDELTTAKLAAFRFPDVRVTSEGQDVMLSKYERGA